MITTMIAIFVIGYILIALEHTLEINKATFALMFYQLQDCVPMLLPQSFTSLATHARS